LPPLQCYVGDDEARNLIQKAGFFKMRLAYGSEALQFGELTIPNYASPHPTVILIHGGFWRNRYDLSLMTPLAEDLAYRGIASWNIEYRRIGNPGGGWPGTLLDVAAAVDALREIGPRYALDLKRVVALGHSSGGHLALWLAGREHLPKEGPLITASIKPLPLGGVVSLAGVADLEACSRLNLSNGVASEFLGGTPDQEPDRYKQASPTALVPLNIPHVLIHGTADDTVPLEVSKRYAALARAADDLVTLIELPNVDHYALINPYSAAWAAIVDATERLLFF
jgi:acetyl esterase/lipase